MSPATRTPAKKQQPPPPVTHPVGERRLLLLDGHSLAYRAFFALPAENFRTAPGRHERRLRLHVDADQPAPRRAPTHVAVAFDVSRRPSAPRGSPSTRPTAQDPDEVPRAGRPDQGRADGAGDPVLAGTTSRPTTSSPPSPPRPRRRAIEVLICTGDRDALQLVSDQVTVLYPARACPSWAGSPRTRSRKATASRPASTRTSRRCAATRRTTCPASPAWGRRRRRSGSASSARSTAWSTGSTR